MLVECFWYNTYILTQSRCGWPKLPEGKLKCSIFCPPRVLGLLQIWYMQGLILWCLVCSAILVFTQVAGQATFYWWCPSALTMVTQVNAFLVQPCQAAGWNLFPNVTLLEEKWSMFEIGLYLVECTSLCQLVVILSLKMVNDTGKKVMLFCLGYCLGNCWFLGVFIPCSQKCLSSSMLCLLFSSSHLPVSFGIKTLPLSNQSSSEMIIYTSCGQK